MTAQLPHNLENGCPDLDLRGLNLYAVILGPVDENDGWGSGQYEFATDPRPDDPGTCSANWEGFVCDFRITADGSAQLINYLYPFSEQAPTPVGEQLSGDFFLLMRHDFEEPRVYVPFTNGHAVCDRSNWIVEDRINFERLRMVLKLADAVKVGDLDSTSLLLDEMRDIPWPGSTHINALVLLACEQGHREVLELLLAKGGSCRKGALPAALVETQSEIAVFLIRTGKIELEEKLPTGLLPLQHAIANDLPSVTISLLLYGATTHTLTELERERLRHLLENNADKIGTHTEDERTAQEMLCVLGKDEYRTALTVEQRAKKLKAYDRAASLFGLARRFGPLRGVSKEYAEKARNKVKGIR